MSNKSKLSLNAGAREFVPVFGGPQAPGGPVLVPLRPPGQISNRSSITLPPKPVAASWEDEADEPVRGNNNAGIDLGGRSAPVLDFGAKPAPVLDFSTKPAPVLDFSSKAAPVIELKSSKTDAKPTARLSVVKGGKPDAKAAAKPEAKAAAPKAAAKAVAAKPVVAEASPVSPPSESPKVEAKPAEAKPAVATVAPAATTEPKAPSMQDLMAKELAEELANASAEEREEMEALLREEAAEKAAEKASKDESKEVAKKDAAATAVVAAPRKKKADADEKAHDDREHLNIVFIGHVDAGKSTISGQILLLTGQVDERTIQKYTKEAKEKNRESWYIAYIMDTNDEERDRGKTVEVGRAHFTTATKRYTLLDAPGHKNYVPNMIGGATQADVGGLVISARKGEFESGFEKGGQTREHAMLAKTLGIQRVLVLVNKMDDPTVNWDQERYNDICNQIGSFLKKWGYKDDELFFLPISGYTGANLRDPVPESVCPWYKPRLSFFQILDQLPPVKRDPGAPLRIPIMARYKEMGSVFVLGKIESGTLRNGTTLVMMPTGHQMDVVGIQVEDDKCEIAMTGENVTIKIKGLEEDDIHVGFVLSETDRAGRKCVDFEAQIQVLDLLDHKPVLTAGYLAMFHIHTAVSECEILKLTGEIDKKTGQPSKKKPKFVKNGGIVIAKIRLTDTVAMESFKDFPQLGRFTLRDEGRTIGIGKVLSITDAKTTAAENQSGGISMSVKSEAAK